MRLRLHFDGSVCAHISPTKCWFLLDKDKCNIVAGLEYLIRDRFELGRGLKLNLYLDKYLLPSMEKIHVVRDNDTLWVELIDINNDVRRSESPTPLSEPVTDVHVSRDKHQEVEKTTETRKRKCPDVTETCPSKLANRKGPSSKGQDDDRSSNESTDLSSLQMEKDSQKKNKRSKKKKKKSWVLDERPKTPTAKNAGTGSCKTDSSKQKDSSYLSSHKKSPRADTRTTKDNKTNKTTETKGTTPVTASKSDKAPKKSHLKSKSSVENKDDQLYRSDSSPAATAKSNGTMSTITPVNSAKQAGQENSKLRSGRLMTQEKTQLRETRRSPVQLVLSSGHIRFQSSESEDSDEDDAGQTSKQKNLEQTITEQPSVNKGSLKPSDATLESRDPLLTQDRIPSQLTGFTQPEQSVGGGQSPHSTIPNGQFQRHHSQSPKTGFYSRENWDKKSQLNTEQSNKSVIIQNPLQDTELPSKDFTSFPPLAGAPRQGDIIAYKILELSESYCPELSDYKEGKVYGFDSATGQIDVELSHIAMATRSSKPGKFDLQWEDEEDYFNTADNTVDLNVSIQLQDLVDPRLVPPTSS